jgi:hypothetical protein
MANPAPLIGTAILAALTLITALPLILGLLMLGGRLRYREWLAGVAVIAAMGYVALHGDYVYNYASWSQSRPSTASFALTCGLLLANLAVLLVLVLRRSPGKRLWAAAFALLLAGAIGSGWGQFAGRRARDREAARRDAAPVVLAPGPRFVPAWRDYRNLGGRMVLSGHLPESLPVVLLTDPFTHAAKPRFCTGTTSRHIPASPDPAVPGNVTEVAEGPDCRRDEEYRLAVLGRTVTSYAQVPPAAVSGAGDARVLSLPTVLELFAEHGYDRSTFDPAASDGRRSSPLAGRGSSSPRSRPCGSLPTPSPALNLPK